MSISAISAFDWSFWLASVLANWIEGLHISKSKPSFLKRGPVEGVSPLRSETLTEIGVGHLAAMVTQPPTRWIYPNAKKLKWIDIQYIYILYLFICIYYIYLYIIYIYTIATPHYINWLVGFCPLTFRPATPWGSGPEYSWIERIWGRKFVGTSALVEIFELGNAWEMPG